MFAFWLGWVHLWMLGSVAALVSLMMLMRIIKTPYLQDQSAAKWVDIARAFNWGLFAFTFLIFEFVDAPTARALSKVSIAILVMFEAATQFSYFIPLVGLRDWKWIRK